MRTKHVPVSLAKVNTLPVDEHRFRGLFRLAKEWAQKHPDPCAPRRQSRRLQPTSQLA